METVQIICEVVDGVLQDPVAISSEDTAGTLYQARVCQKGFRTRLKVESWNAYVTAFKKWVDSLDCPWDSLDYEIHWYELPVQKEVQVQKEPDMTVILKRAIMSTMHNVYFPANTPLRAFLNDRGQYIVQHPEVKQAHTILVKSQIKSIIVNGSNIAR